MTDEEFNERFAGFVSKIQREITNYYRNKFAILQIPNVKFLVGSKYIKLVTTSRGDRGSSVYCFVNKSTGDIYKAASYAAPAKHARGNIFDEDYAWGKAVNIYGGTYL